MRVPVVHELTQTRTGFHCWTADEVDDHQSSWQYQSSGDSEKDSDHDQRDRPGSLIYRVAGENVSEKGANDRVDEGYGVDVFFFEGEKVGSVSSCQKSKGSAEPHERENPENSQSDGHLYSFLCLCPN